MNDHLLLLVVGTLAVAQNVPIEHTDAKKVLAENPFYLRRDPRLQVFLNVDADRPKLKHIAERLSEATGIKMVIDQGLETHQPDFGRIQPSKKGYRAWQLMELVAKTSLKEGFWRQTSEGYQLTGMSLLPPDETKVDSGAARVLAFWFGACALVAVICWIVNRRVRLRRTRKTAPVAAGVTQGSK